MITHPSSPSSSPSFQMPMEKKKKMKKEKEKKMKKEKEMKKEMKT